MEILSQISNILSVYNICISSLRVKKTNMWICVSCLELLLFIMNCNKNNWKKYQNKINDNALIWKAKKRRWNSWLKISSINSFDTWQKIKWRKNPSICLSVLSTVLKCFVEVDYSYNRPTKTHNWARFWCQIMSTCQFIILWH